MKQAQYEELMYDLALAHAKVMNAEQLRKAKAEADAAELVCERERIILSSVRSAVATGKSVLQ